MNALEDQPPKKMRRRKSAAVPQVVVAPRPPPTARLMGWFCRLLVTAFGWTYLALLVLQVLATYDPFNLVPRPLVGVSLIVFGLPWTLSATWFPEGVQYLVAAIAPAINWLILGFLCAWQRRKMRVPRDGADDER